jgi:hypothetical protein
MFSKNTDCLDNYFELQHKTKELKEKEAHSHHDAHKKEHAKVHWKKIVKKVKIQPKLYSKEKSECP